MQTSTADAVTKPEHTTANGRHQFGVWSALMAACASPNDWIVIERDGELFIEPAPTRQ